MQQTNTPQTSPVGVGEDVVTVDEADPVEPFVTAEIEFNPTGIMVAYPFSEPF